MLECGLLTILLVFQDPTTPAAAPPSIRPGGAVSAEIGDDAPQVATPELAAKYRDAPVVGASFLLEPGESGVVTIDLVSDHFDAYLVLRDDHGSTLAENDDGPIGTQAQIVTGALDAARSYRIEAAALHGERGAFRLVVTRGRPAPLSVAERTKQRIEDAGRAVAAREKSRGPDDPWTAAAIDRFGRELEASGAYAQAQQQYERALAIMVKRFGPDAPETGAFVADVALVLKAQGRYAEALPHYEHALAITEAESGPDHPTTAVTLDNLAFVLVELGDLERARPLFERALAIFENAVGPNDPLNGPPLNGLAGILHAKGRFEEARPLYERVLAIREQSVGPDSADTARSLLNLAALLDDLGESTAARLDFERALAINERIFGERSRPVADSLDNLSHVLLTQGDVANARALSERALAIRIPLLGPDHPDTALNHANLASLLMKQGDLADARAHFERALEALERAPQPNDGTLALTLSGFAQLQRAEGAFELALESITRAVAVTERSSGADHWSMAVRLHTMAGILYAKGRCDDAAPLLERSLAICEKRLGPDHLRTAYAVCGLADIRRAQRRFDEAAALYARALAIREKQLGPDHLDTANVRALQGDLLFDRGQPDGAVAQWERALAANESHIAKEIAVMSATDRVLLVQTSRQYLDRLLSVPAGDGSNPSSSSATSRYQLVLRWKGLAARSLADAQQRLRAAADSKTRAQLDDLRAVQAALSHAVFDSAEASAERIAALRHRKEELERELARGVVAPGDPAPSVEAVRRALPAGSAALDFLVHQARARSTPGGATSDEGARERRLSAFVLTAKATGCRWIDLGPTAPIETAVKRWLAELQGARGAGAVTQGIPGPDAAAVRVRQILWDPVADALGDASLVIVSPDSFLGTLPLELLASVDGSLLIEQRSFVYLQDLASLQKLAAEPDVAGATPPGLLVAGGIDYDSREPTPAAPPPGAPDAASPAPRSFTTYWEPLRATRREAEAIAKLHESTFGAAAPRILLDGTNASEERLKQELPRFRNIHLATHGFFEPEGAPSMVAAARSDLDSGRAGGDIVHRTALPGLLPGYLSGLVCAGANRPRAALPSDGPAACDDGFLCAEELGSLDLSQADLVVLSACDTGLGRPECGEGMIGLRRSLRQAGVRTVISSLWKVDDEATAELMKRVYVNLWRKKLGKLDALRDAQLSLLRENRLKYGAARAFDWGAFVLDGAWR